MKIKWACLQREERFIIKCVSLDYSRKRVLSPTQEYYTGDYMEEIVPYLATKNIQRKKSMTTTDKDAVEGYFNLKKSIHNVIHTLFYLNISEFSGNLQGILDEGKYKTSIKIMHKICWKAQ